MRPRKFTKVDLSHTFAFQKEEQLLARTYEQIRSKKEARISWEVNFMFKGLGVNPIEKKIPQQALGVNFAPVKESLITVKQKRVVPTQKTLVKHAGMPTHLRGSNFVKEVLYVRKPYLTIDWENYSSTKRPEEVFESLKECYII